MKLFLSFAAFIFATAPVAMAQNGTQTTTATQQSPNPLSPEEAQKQLADARSLASTTNLWGKRFDWKETGATTADVATHARQLLGPDAPLIEVRGKDTSRSSFVLQEATLGGVLCSLAELANDKVWVFPGRILLSPENALSPDEQKAVENQMAGVWKQTTSWNAQPTVEKATIEVVVPDMKAKLTTKGQTEPLPVPPPPKPQNRTNIQRYDTKTRYASYEISFGELSEFSQQAIQALADTRRSRMYGAVRISNGRPTPVQSTDTSKGPAISPTTHVCWDERSPFQKTLFLRAEDADKFQFPPMEWSVSQPAHRLP